jgi:4-nitrophenyl phosphatase
MERIIMKKYKAYLIDLDGTMYRGKEKITEAVDFVKKLKEKDVPYLFVTNNSSQTPEEVADRLKSFGVPAEPDNVLTTSLATAAYIHEKKPGSSVYFLGENGLKQALRDKQLTVNEEDPDYVIVGMDRALSYEKLSIACLAVRNGAEFLSTNPDIALPTERGFLPGNGSITSVVSVSTERDPVFIGKPEPIIIDLALQKLGLDKEEALMIGDNYHTDILAGLNAEVDTLLVYTGVTTREEMKDQNKKPTYEINSLSEWDI